VLNIRNYNVRMTMLIDYIVDSNSFSQILSRLLSIFKTNKMDKSLSLPLLKRFESIKKLYGI